MTDDIFEAISLWIALQKPKREFPIELTPELEEFWAKVEQEMKDIGDNGFEVEIPFA